MTIKRITYEDAVRQQPDGHLTRRTVSDADDRNIAQRERDGAVNRLVALEREVASLKERLTLALTEAKSLDDVGTDLNFSYLVQLLDLTKPLPAPLVVMPKEDA